jgi:hypothetical protein
MKTSRGSKLEIAYRMPIDDFSRDRYFVRRVSDAARFDENLLRFEDANSLQEGTLPGICRRRKDMT